MPPTDHPILRAWLTSPSAGVVELDCDWEGEALPPLAPGDDSWSFATLKRAPASLYADEAAYYVTAAGDICFVLYPADHPWIDFPAMPVYLAGTFNGWQEAVGKDEWQLQPGELNGKSAYLARVPAVHFWGEGARRFKFVTGDHRWLDAPQDATNVVLDETGHYNRTLRRDRTGRNLFIFSTARPLRLSQPHSISWLRDAKSVQKVKLRLERFFCDMRSDLPLGALVQADVTVFRLFAPRAKHVRLFLCEELAQQELAKAIELAHGDDGVWHAQVGRNLHGWFYWYTVTGPSDGFSRFPSGQKILDPYAQAAVNREGPGIVLDPAWVGHGDRSFRTPAWQDLVIAEAHVRDLAALAPGRATPDERLGFAGLTKWVASPDFYLKKLGVNAVELLPVQEFDNRAREEYHWGYMTANFFAPASAYARDPVHASGVHELQELVAAFHRQGIAVILDVVYNHVGVPEHLMFIDKLYYFEMDDTGKLENWSGCGNDVRCRSAMATRLIIDSLVHLINVYGVDGFRLDLAELIGVKVLQEIEVAVKKVKPDVILIAEPWSFRGHIADALRPTGYASWNDGYRNFLREYVHGHGAADKLEYFLKGSPWHFAFWPAQTVNYTESHDDRTWLDLITENADHNGFHPTICDRRRTHLMAAILFASIGIPMIAAGQDFLRSKYGVNNTYQRGDLNALDYRRLARYPATHAYFAGWIAFRRSEAGRLLRHFSRAGEGFFQASYAPDKIGLALLYNADGSAGRTRLLFAVNPLTEDALVPLGEAAAWEWRLVADHECFYAEGARPAMLLTNSDLFIPALACSLWTVER